MMKELTKEVCHWTIYGIVEGGQTFETAFHESVCYIALEDGEKKEDVIPTIEEVKEALKIELSELQVKNEKTFGDVDQILYIEIALCLKPYSAIEV